MSCVKRKTTPNERDRSGPDFLRRANAKTKMSFQPFQLQNIARLVWLCLRKRKDFLVNMHLTRKRVTFHELCWFDKSWFLYLEKSFNRTRNKFSTCLIRQTYGFAPINGGSKVTHAWSKCVLSLSQLPVDCMCSSLFGIWNWIPFHRIGLAD